MKNLILTAIFLLIPVFLGWSQIVDFGIQTGVGTFSMNDLKEVNSAVRGDLPFDTRTVHDFPVYFYHRPYILINAWRISFGPAYTFQSTGSRVSAKDYSGEYRFDMTVNSHAPGFYTEFYLNSIDRFRLSFYAQFARLFSNLKMNEFLKIGNDAITDDRVKVKAKNLFLEPGLNVRYPIKFLKVGLNIGYQLQIGSRSFYFENNEEAQLINSRTGNPVRAGWSGFRVGLSVSFCFPLTSELPTN